jgi:hypothetical protein
MAQHAASLGQLFPESMCDALQLTVPECAFGATVHWLITVGALHVGFTNCCTPLSVCVQVVSLDLQGFGLVGNLSEGRWPFLEDLPYMKALFLSENPGLCGNFPRNMSLGIAHITATGTGVSGAPHKAWNHVLNGP